VARVGVSVLITYIRCIICVLLDLGQIIRIHHYCFEGTEAKLTVVELINCCPLVLIMHTYGKIGCFSFMVAVILHFCMTVIICLYIHPVKSAHQEEKHAIELHYLTVSSFVLFIVNCLISRLLFQEQYYQVKFVLN
jgi:hypothetical protein